MPSIATLKDNRAHLQQLQTEVNGLPLRERIDHLQQLQKVLDEIERQLRVFDRLEQAQETLRQAAGPDARQWILKSLWDDVRTNFGVFHPPPLLPTDFPDLETTEKARAELEAWAQEAPYTLPAIAVVGVPGLRAKPSLNPGEMTENATPVVESPSAPNETGGKVKGLSFLPGAFVYRGHTQRLGGKPLEVLKAIYAAPGKALTLTALQDKIWPDCETGEETVRCAVMVARKALRRAMKAVKVDGPDDPLPAVDRGTNRTDWRLDLS
jgi:hypothetical protein